MSCNPPSPRLLPTEIRKPPENLLRKFKVENVTTARAPLLKAVYWEFMEIDGLNAKLASDSLELVHDIRIPTRQINTKPLKVIYWLRNISSDILELKLKRIKNCECLPLQTRVGFNQFRQLYHCPHRRLIHILNEHMKLKPDDLVALTVVSYFFLFGEHKLTYEIHCSDKRTVTLNFILDIVGFDPQKCIITKQLIPTDVKEHRRFVQPIWVRNITMQHLNFVYHSRERGLKIINPNLTVPRQSVWPLMVEYRPSDLSNELELTMSFESIRTKIPIKAPSATTDPIESDNTVPIVDVECADFLYVIYPNKLNFNVELSEERSLMVCIHNHNQKCVEFRWQSYIINDLFSITFDPESFRLKPHHSKLCVVHLRVYDRPLHFQRIPTVLEVHRIFDKSTKIAKELLDEVESIDDPKWREDSYMEHVFLHLNIVVNFKKQETLEFKWEPPPAKRIKPMPKKQTTTVFEKLFWEYLSQSNFMRKNRNPEISEFLSYADVLHLHQHPPEPPKPLEVDRNGILKILSQLIAESVSELSKNWRFVPSENHDQLA